MTRTRALLAGVGWGAARGFENVIMLTLHRVGGAAMVDDVCSRNMGGPVIWVTRAGPDGPRIAPEHPAA